MEVAFREQLSWLCLLSEVMSFAILGNGELKFERNVNSNRNGTDKINPISEYPTKIKEVLIFTGSLTSHTRNLGCACAHIFQKRTWGALIGTGVLNRANTEFQLYSHYNLNKLTYM